MSANRMYLVCTHHASIDEALFLGKRLNHGYYKPPDSKAIQEFYNRHESCGGGFDHYTIAFNFPKDHEQQPSVEAAVSAALQ